MAGNDDYNNQEDEDSMNIFRKFFTPRRAWYKARIAELEARLAALDDALVPVVDGEECAIRELYLSRCFLFSGVTYQLHSFSKDKFAAWEISDHGSHVFTGDTLIQPVRLVRVRDMEGVRDIYIEAPRCIEKRADK